jgi:phosphoribosylformimino-5-aminoimidazole carboxamide ribotide isomerase
LETIEDAPEVEMLAWVIGRDHFAFSVDMYAGRPIGSALSWPASPSDVINLAIKNCTEHLILLDLARVGIGSGTGTLDVCSWAKWKYPGVELIAGGGVRGPEDLPALAEAGVDAVLVASALHDGKFGLPGAAL